MTTLGYLGAFVRRLSLAYVGIVNLLEGNALARDGSTSQTLASSGDSLILIGFSQELRPKLNIAAWMKLGLGAAIAMDVGLHLLPKVPAALGFFSGSLMCRQGHRYVLVMWVEWQSIGWDSWYFQHTWCGYWHLQLQQPCLRNPVWRQRWRKLLEGHVQAVASQVQPGFKQG